MFVWGKNKFCGKSLDGLGCKGSGFVWELILGSLGLCYGVTEKFIVEFKY